MRFAAAALITMSFGLLALAWPQAEASALKVCNGPLSGNSGGLTVPRGAVCETYKANVSGRIEVEAGGTLKFHLSNAYGRMIVKSGGNLHLELSHAEGGLTVQPRGNAVIESAHVYRDLVATGTRVRLESSQVHGPVSIRGKGSLSSTKSTIHGSLSLPKGTAADLASTEIRGRMNATRARVNLDQTEIWKKVTFAGGSLRGFKADLVQGIQGSGAGLTVSFAVSQLRGNVRFDSGRSIEIDTSKAGRNVVIGRGIAPPKKGFPLKIINSQIKGNLKTRSGRALQLKVSQITGDLDLGSLALKSQKSTIHRNLIVAGRGSARLTRSAVGGSVIATGARTALLNSSVTGGVRLRKGGNLTADSARFGGDLSGWGSGLKATITGSNFKRGMKLSSGHTVDIKRSKFARSVDLSGLRSAISLAMSSIGGSVKIRSNRAAGKGIRILRNSIRGGLYCFANDRPPRGGRNGVRKKKGQCAKL